VKALKVGREPKQKTWKVKEFFITKFEITNLQFKEFVDAKGYDKKEYWSEKGWKLCQDGKFKYAGTINVPKTWGSEKCDDAILKQPVTGISYYEAEAFCNYKGWSLPTHEQWLISAGWDNTKKSWREYPWGSNIDKKKKIANFSSEGNRAKIANVGDFKNDVSYFGIFDCAGNVREWILSPSNTEKTMVLGGHFLQEDIEENARIDRMSSLKKTERESYTGFRCVVVLENPEK
jgi:formylglycine-generating enzyme required for sulfatase activity